MANNSDVVQSETSATAKGTNSLQEDISFCAASINPILGLKMKRQEGENNDTKITVAARRKWHRYCKKFLTKSEKMAMIRRKLAHYISTESKQITMKRVTANIVESRERKK